MGLSIIFAKPVAFVIIFLLNVLLLSSVDQHHLYALGSSSSSSSSSSICPGFVAVPNPSPSPDAKSPHSFTVRFYTDVLINGNNPSYFTLEVFRDWAPNSADRFYSLVLDKYYDNSTFFRVVPSFVTEFGIAATNCESSKWFTNVAADPVTHHNVEWTVAFAADFNATTMTQFTTQLFVNYANNTRLDAKGFAPFGVITNGFDTLTNLINPTPNSTDGIDQKPIYNYGNVWVYQNYPNVSAMTKVAIISEVYYDDDQVPGDSGEPTIDLNLVTNIVIMTVMSLIVASLIFAIWKFKFVNEKCCKSKRSMRDYEEADTDQNKSNRFIDL